MAFLLRNPFLSPTLLFVLLLTVLVAHKAVGIRIPDRISSNARELPLNQPLKTAVFALGSFWRSEAVFGCLDGVVCTTVGYAGGSKSNPEYRSLGHHAESVQVEYDPRLINFRKLLEVFWSSHDSRQVFGQGPDVGNQYRSVIFTNGSEESRLASASKQREQLKSRSSIVTTQIQSLGTFYPAEPEHQATLGVEELLFLEIYGRKLEAALELFGTRREKRKFELKRKPFLLQLMGNLPEEELERSTLATKLNGYAAELCPLNIQKQIDAKINDIIKKGWPVLRDV